MPTVQMKPPDDGSRNSVTVSGRTYSSLPQMAIAVQNFDADALAANGWQNSAASNESWAARLRRLRGAARNNNPVESPPLVGGRPWVTATVYAIGDVVSSNGEAYQAITAGTSGATAPGATAATKFSNSFTDT